MKPCFHSSGVEAPFRLARLKGSGRLLYVHPVLLFTYIEFSAIIDDGQREAEQKLSSGRGAHTSGGARVEHGPERVRLWRRCSWKRRNSPTI